MSKAMRSLICVMMSAVMMLSMHGWAGVAVAAETSAVQPRYSYASSASTDLSIDSAGTATCTATLQGYSGTTTKIYVKMELQYASTVIFNTIKTWTATYNSYRATMEKTTTVDSGRYRLKVTFTVYSGSASEEISVRSSEKTVFVN